MMGNPPFSLPVMVLIIISSVLLSSKVSAQCLSDQQSVLLELKQSLISYVPKSKKLFQWNESSNCCVWDGVTCDEKGHVTGLDLSNEWISGEIGNSSLFNLQHLKSLDLSFNNFHSTISSRIGNLTSLTYLNLSNAGFGGQIPQQISQLTSLVTLDISTTSMLRSSTLKLENPNLSILVQHLSKLEELYLDGVNISATGSDWCQALSSSVPNLRVLSLSNSYLSGPLDPSLEKLVHLSVIHLDFNNLFTVVPGFLANFSNLTSMHLGSCGLYGTFPSKIFQVQTLQTVDISNNQLLHGSFPEFPRDNALQRLVLSYTNFSGRLPLSIGRLWNLRTLDLSICQFNGTLPSSVGQLTQLLYVDLTNNKFVGPVPSFKMSKNLTKIFLSHNSLSGEISLAHWEGLMNLVVVDLRNNLLNGTIPSSLFALPSLEVVQLSHNKFDGPLPKFLNVSSTILDLMDLSSNNLEGPIPMSIFGLRKLSILSLSSNKLNGTVQLDKFQEFRNLTSLDLSYNNLSVIARGDNSTGSSFSKIGTLKLASCKLKVFPYLKNQSKLVHLDLSDNQIHGEVPNWIWKLGNGFLHHLNLSHNNLVSVQKPYNLPNFLDVLDLHLNQIRGKIPILPPVASYVDFSCNNFTSSIPEVRANGASNLYFYSLSNNSLTGSIPESICSASYLQVLDLSHNMLSGKLPKCMPTLTQSLGVLNLRRNNFSGRIPDSFPVNCVLKTIDLNGNFIEGQIPKSLANCRNLEVLNLGNNDLDDIYPCMLKNISTLRVLVLRSNKFHGWIGCPQTNGTWAKLQILDLALNKFDGKLPGECVKKWKAMSLDEDADQSRLNHIRFEFLKFNPSLYYQDTLTVTLKGLEIELQKILTLFTSIDLSCNMFSGPIPEEFGLLQAIYSLNLSHNALTGRIPSTVDNLRHLESLDLSSNNLSGTIPVSLAALNFLSFLDLSSNQLVGMIPTGTQIQSFPADHFKGNKGFCGPPLTVKCSNISSESTIFVKKAASAPNWDIIVPEIGFIIGFGSVFVPIFSSRRFRRRYYRCIDGIVFKIFPRALQRIWFL